MQDVDSRAVDDTAAVVRRLVAETCGIGAEEVRDDGLLLEYGLDSVRAMDLVISLEEAFGIHVKDEDAATLRRVEDVVRYVEAVRR